jgi:hypothetical protein
MGKTKFKLIATFFRKVRGNDDPPHQIAGSSPAISMHANYIIDRRLAR